MSLLVAGSLSIYTSQLNSGLCHQLIRILLQFRLSAYLDNRAGSDQEAILSLPIQQVNKWQNEYCKIYYCSPIVSKPQC